MRIAAAAGTVTSALRDPPHPPANKPLMTVCVDPNGKPDVRVENDRARARILDG